jgi:endonuclease YncB( thermonuclease family)
MYEYSARVARVVDGDTLDLTISLGFDVAVSHRCRLFGVNAAEHGTVAGDAAKAWLTARLPVGAEVRLQTKKDKTEKYGRYLAVLHTGSDKAGWAEINLELIAAGHAVAWDGKGKRPT